MAQKQENQEILISFSSSWTLFSFWNLEYLKNTLLHIFWCLFKRKPSVAKWNKWNEPEWKRNHFLNIIVLKFHPSLPVESRKCEKITFFLNPFLAFRVFFGSLATKHCLIENSLKVFWHAKTKKNKNHIISHRKHSLLFMVTCLYFLLFICFAVVGCESEQVAVQFLFLSFNKIYELHIKLVKRAAAIFFQCLLNHWTIIKSSIPIFLFQFYLVNIGFLRTLVVVFVCIELIQLHPSLNVD